MRLPGLGRADREFFDIDPWTSISEGTLLPTVDPSGVDDVLAALEAENIPAAGEVVEGSGPEADGEDTDHPGVDPFRAALEAYAQFLDEVRQRRRARSWPGAARRVRAPAR